jgi:iron complex outermembrane receptor protein
MDVNNWTYKNDHAFSNTGFVFVTRDGKQSNRAIFATSDWLLTSQTRLVAGYRSETIQKSAVDTGFAANYAVNNKVSANELAINQSISQGLDIYARMAKSYRVANIDDYTSASATVPLRPQISNDKELGVKYRTSKTSASARYFVQNTTDEIAFDQTLFINTNFAPTKRSGIELQGSADISSTLTLSGSVQSMSAIFESGANAGKHIPLVNEKTASARATYRLNANQSLEAAVRMLGSSYFNNDPANACVRQIPSSRMYDAQYRWKDKNIEFSIAAINLTNQSTYNFGFNCTTGSLYPEPGRTLRAAVKYNF